MRAVAFMATLLLTACVSTPLSTTPAPAISRPLVAPATLGGERAVKQIVRGAVGTREMTLNCVVTVKDGTMTVVGLSAMGVRLFTVRYDGHDIRSENSVPIPGQLTPERLVADLQLVFWPLDSLQSTLHAAGWQLNEPAPATRRLRRDERLIAEAHYADQDPWNGRSWLVNFEHGYSLQIDSRAL